jgi:hypothetical protein
MESCSSRSGDNRRAYPRFGGVELVANIGGKLVRVVEVCATGMTVENKFTQVDGPVDFALYPCDGVKLDVNKGIHGTAIIIHADGPLVGLRFEPATLALVEFAADHIRWAEAQGH